jgi:hypothetical protein
MLILVVGMYRKQSKRCPAISGMPEGKDKIEPNTINTDTFIIHTAKWKGMRNELILLETKYGSAIWEGPPGASTVRVYSTASVIL